MSKTLAEMKAEVNEYCQAKGWRKHPLSFGDKIALLHSEVSEALEAYRNWGLEDATGIDEAGFVVKTSPPKPEGVGSEFADVLIRLLDDCAYFGIDLEAEYERKMAFNRSRPYRHGGKAL